MADTDDDGGRTRMGNTPTCEDCGEDLDHCICGDDDGEFGLVSDLAEICEDLGIDLPAPKRANVAQLDLFGGGL